ncbi:hypothetical protein [Tolypothrix sp. VBCCA 56010]|uniref:hypothetical protein n=1 Tax=Tolypothrix sp. VBCCA 56010 TaxID=3137731 RepID=UPI003D7E609B
MPIKQLPIAPCPLNNCPMPNAHCPMPIKQLPNARFSKLYIFKDFVKSCGKAQIRL